MVLFGSLALYHLITSLLRVQRNGRGRMSSSISLRIIALTKFWGDGFSIPLYLMSGIVNFKGRFLGTKVNSGWLLMRIINHR